MPTVLERPPVRSAELADDLIEGWAAPYGGVHNGQDLYGEHFCKATDFALDWFEERPLLYHHGLDEDAGISKVGTVKTWALKEAGLWAQAQLDKASKYFDAIKDLVDRGKLFFSTGAMHHLVKTDVKSGAILQWPWVELSLTPTPANLLATLDWGAAEAAAAKSLRSIDPASIRAVWSTAKVNDLPDSAFAYVEDGEKDSDGKTTPRSKRHFPIRDEDGDLDAAHVKDALGRIPQSDLPDAARTRALGIVRHAAKKLGIAVGDDQKAADLKTLMESADTAGGFVANGKPKRKKADGTDDADEGQETVEKKPTKAAPPVSAGDEGSYEDLRDDLTDLLNPSGPFEAGAYAYVVQTFPGYCIACRRESGDDESTYWRVAYTIGDDGEPKLGKATQVEQTWTEVAGAKAAGPLAIDTDDVARRAAGLVERARAAPAMSAARRQVLARATAQLEGSAAALRAYLGEAERKATEAQRQAALASPSALKTRLDLLNLFEASIAPVSIPADAAA